MANQEQLDLLTQGVEAWNQWKADTHETLPEARWHPRYDADLSGADLQGANLNEANLGKVDLAGANFAGASLLGACLAESELAEVNFVGAHLAGVDMRGANICAADFTNADLSNANLRGADLSQARFQGANLSGARLDQEELREARLQGAIFNEAQASAEMTHKVNADRQGAKQGGRPFPRKQIQGQDIILYTRAHGRSLRLIGTSLVFVIAIVWLLQRPANLVQVVIGIVALVLFGLGVVLILIFFLRQLFSHTPLLVINDEGIQYCYPFLLETVEKNPMTRENITWQEIGAIGVIKMDKTNFFAVYASANRWRSGWTPSIRFPQSLLPLSVNRLLDLMQERYQIQIAANGIEIVEIADAPSSSR